MSSTSSPIDFLCTRKSVKFVQAPAPSQAELDQILQSAMSAPDHGKLQPWRFRLITGQAIGKLADLAMQALTDAGTPVAPEKERNVRNWLAEVPLLIAVACKLEHSNTKIPEKERMLATGAAVMNILNAAHALGYGAFWSTGLGTYTEDVPEALGFDALEYRFMGFLAVGTPIDEQFAQTRPDYRQFVAEWTGE